MCPSSGVTVSLCLLLCLSTCLSSDVTVKPGEDATLQFQRHRDADVTVLKWKKLDSECYAYFYRDNHLYENYQHPSCQDRVELKDPKMKDGDVSVILKNVNANDAGRYECHVKHPGQDLKFIRAITVKVEVPVNVTAEPGEDVSLPCRAPSNTNITAAEWTRPELELEYVLLYRDGWPDPHHQHPSYQNRVELEDREMKDGNVTMILKNVTSNDTGRYECRVFMRKTKIWKRSTDTEPISTIYLQVQPGDKEGGDEEGGDKEGGDSRERIALEVSLTALLVVVVAFIIYKKSKLAETAEQSPARPQFWKPSPNPPVVF